MVARPDVIGMSVVIMRMRVDFPGRGGVQAGRRALQLCLGDEHVGGHSRHVSAVGIVETNFQHDGLDVALAPAYVSLGGKIGFRGLEEYFAGSDGPTRKTYPQRLPQADVIGLSFR